MPAGQLTESLHETLALFDRSGAPLTTTEVADRLDLGRRSTYARLDRLVDRGRLETKKVGASARVWWRPGRGASDGLPSIDLDRTIESESLGELLDLAEVGLFVLDSTHDVVWMDVTAERYLGLDRSSVVGRDQREVVREAVAPIVEDPSRFAETVLATYRSDAGGEQFEFRVTAGEGRAGRWLEHRSKPIESGRYAGGRVEVYYDVTDRKLREEALRESERRNRTLVDNFPNGVVALFDRDLRHTLAGGEAFDVHDLSIDDVEGKTVREIFPPFLADEIEPHFRAVFDGETREFEVEAGGRYREFRTRPVRDGEGAIVAGFAMSQEVTDRRRRERALEESRNRYQTLVENFPNGAVGLVDEDLRYITMGGSPVEEARASAAELEGERVGEVLPQSMAERLVPRYADALDGRRSSFEAEIGDNVYQFRVLPVRNDDGEVTAALGMSQDVTERVERERELERQREQLAALNNLNDIVHEITEAVIEQSTRAEIEEIVCERLAAADSYRFAWIGEVDMESGTIVPRTEAGVEGYLDEITITVDPEDVRSHGPGGRAVRDREMKTARDISSDADFNPWREAAEAFGFRSTAAIPITHEGTFYGVLSVYAERPHAFTDEEQGVIGRLGEVVGHAIAAVERKRALTSDEVVELGFKIDDVFDVFDVPTSADETITLEQAMPIGEGTFLVYGTAVGDGIEAVEAMVDAERHPDWESATVLDAEDGVSRFRLQLSDPPLLSTVTSLGGYVDEMRFEDGDYYLRIHYAPTTDARTVVDAVEGIYPTIDLLTHRQLTRDRPSIARFRGAVFDELTESQRGAVEAAYYGGYYATPRLSTGEEIADSLGVSPPTFHHHLRKAHRTILSTLLERNPGPDSDQEGVAVGRS